MQRATRLVQEQQASGVGLLAAIMRIHLPVYLAVAREAVSLMGWQGQHMIFRAHIPFFSW
jgi:hypothetical protein